MNTTVPHNYDHVQQALLSREAYRAAGVRYSERWQWHLYQSWCDRIAKAERLPVADACVELERLLAILKG